MKKSYYLASAAFLTIMPLVSYAQELTLVRVATMPAGAEVTGVSTNVYGDLFLNAQHPGGNNTYKDDAPAALVGYIKGFDPSQPSMSVPAEDARTTVSAASGEYVIFGAAGQSLGNGQLLGGVYDVTGKLMYVSNTPDFNGFISTGANTGYLYTAWEGAGRDGASSVSKMSLTRANGAWTADLTSSKMLDLSSIHGGAVLCSGTVTPWGTPLLAEEYFFYNTATWNHPDNHDADEKPGFAGGNDVNFIKPKNMSQYLGELANPYRYGYMIEINNAASAEDEELGAVDVQDSQTG